MADLQPGEAVTCPECGRRIGHRRGRIANHKTTVAVFTAAAGEDKVRTTVRCLGSQQLLSPATTGATDLMKPLRASLEQARAARAARRDILSVVPSLDGVVISTTPRLTDTDAGAADST